MNYYFKHKDEIKEYNRIYKLCRGTNNNNETAKERYYLIREYLLAKVECSCGCLISRVNLKRHTSNKKHLRKMQEK